jgi:hypothetical protein
LVTEIELSEYGAHSFLDFWWGWMKSAVYDRKVDIRDVLLARILDAATIIKNREDQLRTRDLRTRVAKCAEVEGGISERLL